MIRPVTSDGRVERGGVFKPVRRSRVVERIASAAVYRIVLVVAPAGYGKSLAVDQYLETREDAFVRFNVQPDHASLLGFLRGLTEALSPIAPYARKNLRAAYEANGTSPNAGSDLAMWMYSHLKGYDGLIAIDDLHLAESDREVSDFLTSLIYRTRGRCRWLLASRSTLSLPVGSWLAYGEMDLTIDEDDLKFTLTEAREAAKAARVAVRDDELEQLLQMTGGWATALSFALRSSTRSVDLRNVTANTQEMVYRYLAEQVYRGLSKEERLLLHFVSYLDDIELDVLRKAGYAQAKAIVEGLRDRVAFIYPERPSVYRCHELFRAFLRHQLELEGDSAVTSLQLHVARTLESLGRVAAALRTFAQASSFSDVIRLLESNGFDLFDQGHGDVVLYALRVISQDVRATNPSILGLRALIAADAGHLDRAESLLQRAIARAGDLQLRTTLAIRLSLILVNQMRDAAPMLAPLLNEPLSRSLRGEIVSLVAISHAYSGRQDAAKDAFRTGEALVDEVESDQDRAKILHRLSTAMARAGQPVETVRAMQERAAALAAELGLFSLAGRCYSSLASIALFYEGDTTKETWYAQQASTASMKAGDRSNVQTALLQLMDIEGRRGNADRLQGLEKQLAAVATSDTNRLIYVIPVRAIALAWLGKFDQAHRLMATVADDSRFFDFDRAFNAAIDALFLVAEKRRDEALVLVARALSLIEETETDLPHAARQNEIARLLCAVVESFANRRVNAERIVRTRGLAAGPMIAALRAVAMSVIRLGPSSSTDELSENLEQLGDAGLGGLSRILAVAVNRWQAEAKAPEVLTSAQIKILEALAAGRTPKDIARETGRSLFTVQTHIQNVIRRLGCSGRNEALSVARSRGILNGN